MFCNKLLSDVEIMVRLIKVLNLPAIWERLLKLELLFILFLLFKLVKIRLVCYNVTWHISVGQIGGHMKACNWGLRAKCIS